MNSKIPKWLSSYIQIRDINAIEITVQSAEKKTSGEIVPIIVHRSSTTGHVPIILVLIFSTVYFSSNLWEAQLSLGVSPWLVALSNLAIGFLLTLALSRRDAVVRLLTPQQDLIDQCERRALVEFYNHKVHRTESATGILIFLSILEHRAIVLGDEAIAKKLPADSWQKIVDTLVGGIKNKQTLKGLITAIEMSGTHLQKHFPRTSDDVDELENHLIIKD